MSKAAIREYWQDRLPQRWYSKKEYGTEEYWDEVTEKRYSIYYPYLKIEAEFNKHKGEKLLEVGIGVGTDILQYAKAGADVTGIDLVQSAIDITNERFKMKGLKGMFEVCDTEKLIFKDNTFDFVYCFGVLHHTPDTYRAIQEIKRVLRPEGKAIIMLYAKGWKHYVIRLFYHGVIKRELFRMSKQDVINKNTEVEGNSPLTKVYNKSKVKQLFNGWSETSIKRYRMGAFFEYSHYGMVMLPRPIRWLSKFLKLERILGENWLIKATK